MITDETISAEAKFLNKLTVRNCTNFLLTSNNEYYAQFTVHLLIFSMNIVF